MFPTPFGLKIVVTTLNSLSQHAARNFTDNQKYFYSCQYGQGLAMRLFYNPYPRSFTLIRDLVQNTETSRSHRRYSVQT